MAILGFVAIAAAFGMIAKTTTTYPIENEPLLNGKIKPFHL
ncbi:MAG TPA: hypothetical protein VE445_03430 [Nitrososphaeraceae archaeon]|nr:hypothetical protein [Nitrososphaeraceae archaeon]